MGETTKTFKPTLGLLDGTMIVAGSMIGSGIFIVAADITRVFGNWPIYITPENSVQQIEKTEAIYRLSTDLGPIASPSLVMCPGV